MIRNSGTWDRVLRVVVGITLLALGWGGFVHGGVGLFFKIIGFVPLATGLLGWCPAYTLFGIKTCPAPPRDARP